MIERLLSLLDRDAGDDRDDLLRVRPAYEIESKIDELDQALEDPHDDFELMANRAARDALVWSLGVDRQDVVVDMRAYKEREERGDL